MHKTPKTWTQRVIVPQYRPITDEELESLVEFLQDIEDRGIRAIVGPQYRRI